MFWSCLINFQVILWQMWSTEMMDVWGPACRWGAKRRPILLSGPPNTSSSALVFVFVFVIFVIFVAQLGWPPRLYCTTMLVELNIWYLSWSNKDRVRSKNELQPESHNWRALCVGWFFKILLSQVCYIKFWFEKVCHGLTRRALWVVGNEHKTFAVSLPGDKKPHWEQNKDKYITQLQTRIYLQIYKHVFVWLSTHYVPLFHLNI